MHGMGNCKIKWFFEFPARSQVTILTELFLQFLWNETSCACAACDGQVTWLSFGRRMNMAQWLMVIDISRTLKKKSCPITTSFTTNFTRTVPELNPGCHGVNFATVLLQVQPDLSGFVKCGMFMGQWICFGTCEVHVVFSLRGESDCRCTSREPVWLVLWQPCLAPHPSEWRRTGSLAAGAIHEMRLSALYIFYSTLRTKTSSWIGAYNNKWVENDWTNFELKSHILGFRYVQGEGWISLLFDRLNTQRSLL
jgi:hypothetical protein